MKETIRITESDLPRIAKEIVDQLSSIKKDSAKVVFLEGELGAGKTTFAKEIAQTLGVTKEDVHSPTFILKKEYTANHPHFTKLVHVDAYRFDTKEEGNILKLEEDAQHPRSLILIEWPSKLAFDEKDMTLQFSVIDDETRDVEVTLE